MSGNALGKSICAALAFMIACVVCFANLRGFSISPLSDEIIHIRATHELFHADKSSLSSWLVPTHGERPYYNKPPLKMWLTLPFLAALGEGNVAYRLPDALFGFGTLALVYWLTISFFTSHLAALVAVLALAGSPTLVLGEHGFRHATQDAALVFFSTSFFALFGLVYLRRSRLPGLTLHDRQVWPVIVLGALSFASALMVKSVAALLVPGALLAAVVLNSELRRKAGTALVVMGLGGIAIAALYFAPVIILYPDYLKIAFGREIFERVTSGMHNQRETWFYLEHLFLKDSIFESSLVAFAILLNVALVSRFRAPRDLSLLCLVAIPLVILTASQSRLVWYLAPTFPALAVMLGGVVALAIKGFHGELSFLSGKGSTVFPVVVRAMGGAVLAVILWVVLRDYQVTANRVLNPARERLITDRLVAQLLATRNDERPLSVVLVNGGVSLRANPKRGKFNVEGLYLRFLGAQLLQRSALPPIPTPEFDRSYVIVRSGELPASSVWLNRKEAILPPFGARKDELLLLRPAP
jgi:4-amino-4-deoxy-L-arabinose transferase-like glycosyltransferase